MATVLLVLVIIAVVAALVFGVVTLLSGDDPGLAPAEPDSWSHPLPRERSLTETDLRTVRFDVTLMGYRMAQVDRMLRRTAYDVGYKDEMIAVLEAEVAALREGRTADAELLRKAREAAASPTSVDDDLSDDDLADEDQPASPAPAFAPASTSASTSASASASASGGDDLRVFDVTAEDSTAAPPEDERPEGSLAWRPSAALPPTPSAPPPASSPTVPPASSPTAPPASSPTVPPASSPTVPPASSPTPARGRSRRA